MANYQPEFPLQLQPGSRENISGAMTKIKKEIERIYRLLNDGDASGDINDINDKIDDIIDGTTKVGKAKEADVALKTKGTLTIERNGTSLGSFNGLTDTTIDIKVPTSLSDFGPADNMITKYFTNGTFVVPAGVTKIYVTAYAGKGGYGTNASYTHPGSPDERPTTVRWFAGNGGFGAHVYNKPIDVTPGETIKITVGLEGSHFIHDPNSPFFDNAPNVNGGKGGSTVIGTHLTLTGGEGGIAARQGRDGVNGASATPLEYGIYNCPCEIRCSPFDKVVYTENQRKEMFTVEPVRASEEVTGRP